MQALIGKFAGLIINPIIVLGFVVATIYFFIGVIKFISNADSDTDLQKNKDTLMYGIIGFVVMFSVYGILRFVLATFNIPCELFFCSR